MSGELLAALSVFALFAPWWWAASTSPLQGRLHVHGRPFSVHTEARGGGKHRYEVTVARLELGDGAPVGG